MRSTYTSMIVGHSEFDLDNYVNFSLYQPCIHLCRLPLHMNLFGGHICMLNQTYLCMNYMCHTIQSMLEFMTAMQCHTIGLYDLWTNTHKFHSTLVVPPSSDACSSYFHHVHVTTWEYLTMCQHMYTCTHMRPH